MNDKNKGDSGENINESGRSGKLLLALRNISRLIIREKKPDNLVQASCNYLSEIQGYEKVVIFIFGNKYHSHIWAESGNMESPHELKTSIIKHQYPAFLRKAMKQKEIILIKETECSDYFTENRDKLKPCLICKLAHEKRVFGFLMILARHEFLNSMEDQTLLTEAVQDISYALSNLLMEQKRKVIEESLRRKNLDLGERVKELKCLYGISKLISNLNLSIDEVFKLAAELLPPSWQYPEITCGRITLHGVEYKTENYRDSQWNQSAGIFIKGEKIGVVEVNYLCKMPTIDEGPFLKEERHLIDALGILLGNIARKKEDEENLKNSLAEKEVLLKELHHRGKNNLQLISTLLKFQARHSKDQENHRILKELQNRLNIMAMLHDRLYQSELLSDIDFETYLKSIVINIVKSLNFNSEKIYVNLDIGDLKLDVNKAIPCAMVINELVTNSFKHAFREDKEGEIKILFKPEGKNSYIISVSDNGTGIPETIDLNTTKSLGLKIVRLLVQQLHGDISITRNGGTQFEIRFTK